MLNFLKEKFAISDPDRFLKTDHLMADLKGRSVRGGVATLGSQAFKFILQMGTTAVLARLLAPEDYGLVGMTTVVTGFITIFKDLGLSEATVQKEEVSYKQVSTLFWLNLGLGVGFALLVIVLSPLVASFYKEPRIVGIMMALSINFVISGFAVQHRALIRRQLQFGKLAKITIFSNTVGPVIAIYSASAGYGYWALVHMFISSQISYLIAIYVACPWIPGLPDFKSGIGSMLRFGSNLTGFYVVNYFSRNLDNILIGKFWGTQQLGLYTKAYQLVLLPINQINQPVAAVAVPALSRLQKDPDKYQRYLHKAALLITSIGMPIVCYLFAIADNLIVFLLGEQWISTIPIFQWLMPAALVGTFYSITGWCFQSLDKTNRQFKWGIINTFLDVITFLIGIKWGAIGVAAAYGLTRPAVVLVSLKYCFNGTFIETKALLLTILRPLLASLFAAAIVIICQTSLTLEFSALLTMAIKFVVFSVSYILVWILIPGGKKSALELIRLRNSLR